ncbi:MAG: ATP-binding cassette domain-containing protein [Candidatus Promineifilaceae bacterium]
MSDNIIIRANGVKKTYNTGKVIVQALRGLDLTVKEGEMVAIMGPSGCGKTTLLNTLSGLDAIDEGVIEIGGRDLAQMTDKERTAYRAANMGFVFQFYNLLPVLSAIENVEMPLLLDYSQPHQGQRGAQNGPRSIGSGGTGRAKRTTPHRAIRWSATACDHRPRPGQQTGHRLGGRTHRRPGQPHLAGNHGFDAPPESGKRANLCHRDPFPGDWRPM